MTTMTSADKNALSTLAAIRAAAAAGHPDIVWMLATGKVRAYTLVQAGWVIDDYERPFAKGTAAGVLVDRLDPAHVRFYIVPLADAIEIGRQEILKWNPGGVQDRKRTPGSHQVTPPRTAFQQYENCWDFYTAK
jgi:hypothetical protein